MAPSARMPLAVYLLVQAGLLRGRKLHPVLATHALERAGILEGGLAAFVRRLPESDERLLLLAPWPSAMASSSRVAPPSTPS